MSHDLTDRERLLLAGDELRQRGYFVTNPASLQCCQTCALAEVPEDVPGFVLWDFQRDFASFGRDADACAECGRFCQAWTGGVTDDPDSLYAAELAHVMAKHSVLVGVLFLVWAGDAGLIVDALRRHGLDARRPPDLGRCIEVVPTAGGQR